MAVDYEDRVRALTPAKTLYLAAYGESVAAYRYRTLSERTENETNRNVFAQMAEEEQGHHAVLQEMLKEHYPGSEFVLSLQDKELVIVGPRLLEVTDTASIRKALGLIHESELLTGRFYETLHQVTPRTDFMPFLKEMADECFAHAHRLTEIEPPED